MMFFEYAVWGAWSPVLAARLLGPLKMTGKQTGWIYATMPLASIIAPLLAGHLADRWINAEWLLLGAHLLGAGLLFAAAREKRFGPLFGVMGLYALCYAATVPLVNAVMFSHLTHGDTQSPGIFIWAPVAWVLSGGLLSLWRRMTPDGDGSDCLKLAGILSLVMAASCLLLPRTPPTGSASDPLAAFALLKDTHFLLFLAISFVVTTQLQFYYLGTAQFLQEIGVKSKNVPAVMTIAQVAQVIATLAAMLGLLILGPRTLAAGALCWLGMYLAYAIGRPRSLVILSQSLHGIAYVFLIIGGQIYVNQVASPDIRNSAQGLLTVVTLGFGLFLGTQFTGVVMDRLREAGSFRWRPIFLVPCVLTLAAAVGLLLLFNVHCCG
jgi:nucleoside transporter